MENTLINKKSGFTMIENCVLRNPLISRNARLVYGILLSYSYGKNACFPGQVRIAAELGLSERVVRDLLNELRGLGLISWKQLGLGKPNLYYIEEIPVRLKDEYNALQLKISTAVHVDTEETTEERNDRYAKRRKTIKEKKEVNTLAGRMKKHL